MTNDDEAAATPAAKKFDQTLRQQLQEIEQEETPERLLILARRLQDLLRRKTH